MFFTDRRTTHSDILTDLNDDERIPVLFEVPADTTQSSTPFFDNEPSNTLDLDLGADQDDDLPDGSQSGSGLDIALANIPKDAGLEPISIETGIVESQPQGQPENIGSDITLSSSFLDSTPRQSPDDDPSEGTDLPDNGEPEAVDVWNAPDATPIDFPIVNISTGQEVHLETCACAGCSMRPEPVDSSNDGSTLAEPTVDSAASPLGDLADFLREGYWGEPGNQRSHNVSSSGTDPNNGVLHYNVTNNGDSPYVDDPNGLTEDRKVLVREAFKVYEQVLGIDFVETTSTDTSVVDFFFSDNDSGAYAGSYVSGNTITLSYINVSQSWSGGTSTYDDYTLQTILHEIGHALGLGHQGQYNGSANYGTDNDFENDSWQASMMSYFSQTENGTVNADYELLQTPMSVDWMALDDLYGAQTSSTGQTFGTENAFTGDTVYGFNTNITSEQSDIWANFKDYAGRTASTIIDTGGIDTLDVSGYTANQLINLRETTRTDTAPSASNIGGSIGNLTIAEGTIIENAKGGSGADTFLGNSANNSFWGNGGNDTFQDSAGSDTYYGGDGTDQVNFFDTFSNFVFEISGTFLSVINVAVKTVVDLVENTVEWLGFSDQTKSFQDVYDTVGTEFPSVAIVAASDEVGPNQGALSSGSVTDETDPVLTGTLSAALETNQSVVVYVDGTAESVTATTNGTEWSYSLSGLSEKNYTFTARVEATDGNNGAFSSDFDLTVDTTAPSVTVDALITSDTTPELTGTVDDPTAAVEVAVSGRTYEATVDGSGNWSVLITATLDEGAYDVNATATDAAGNTATDSIANELTVDTTAPLAPTVDALEAETATPTLTGTAILALGEILTVQVAGQTFSEVPVDDSGNWSVPITTALAEGEYNVIATVTDAAGNSTSDSTAGELIVDADAPVEPTVVSLTTAETTPVVTGTAALNADESLSVQVGSETFSNVAVDGSGQWSVEVTSQLPDGTYDVVATVTDSAGNTVSDSTSGELIVDSTIGQKIYGSASLNDNLTGGSGNDTISGLEKDSIASGAGTIDTLTGGGGDDLFLLGLAETRYYDDGNDKSGNTGTGDYAYITDFGTGNDTIQLSGTGYLFEAWTIDGVSGTGIFYDSDLRGGFDKKDELIGFLANTDPNLVASTPNIDGLTLLTYAGGDDTTPPVVTVNSLTTSDTTPELTGTVDDPTALILVTVNNEDYAATNNGNGTWTLADDTIGALTVGTTYEVLVVATDAAGNKGRDGSTNELEITQTVLDPVLYGTEGSDTVTGNDLDNTVWGISQTSAETGSGDTGAGTVDTLIGGGGADTFVLGDDSRIFYDDGNDRAGNNGKNDYAFIADFVSGTDKIQLFDDSGYLLNDVAGDTEIYRDANGDNAFDSRDELIGVVGGVTLTELISSDFTYV